MASYTHILNTVSEQESAGLCKVQNISITCINQALSRTKPNIKIDFIQFSAFNQPKPWFENVQCVKTELALNKLPGFEKEKALPFLVPVMKEIKPLIKGEYTIYTNIDIIPTQEFYNVIDLYIEKGYDAIVINRRRVSQKYLDDFNYDLMMAETGHSHTGYDTFIFKTELIDQFASANVCIGIPPACNELFYNVFCFAKNPILFTEKNLTFHIGMELYKEWGKKHVERYNYSEFYKILKQLKPHIDITKFPASELGFFKRHFKWFMNPTFSYPFMFKMDLKQLGKKRKERKKREVKGGKQRFLEWLIKKVNFKD